MGGGIDAKRGAPRAGGSTSSVEGEGFDGQLRCASLADLIQLECSTRARNAVSVHSDGREGHLFFEDGQIVHAIAPNGLEGEAAAFEMLGWTTGTFGRSNVPWPPAPSVTFTWQQLLLSAAQRRDEQQRDLPGVSMSRLKAVRGSASPPASSAPPAAMADPWLSPALRPSSLAPPASLERINPNLAFDPHPLSSQPPRAAWYARRGTLGALALALLALGVGWGVSFWMGQRASTSAKSQDEYARTQAASAAGTAQPATAPSGPASNTPPEATGGTPSAASAATPTGATNAHPTPPLGVPANPNAPSSDPSARRAIAPSGEAAASPAIAAPEGEPAEPVRRKPPVVMRRPPPPPPAPARASPAPTPPKPPDPPAAKAWDNESPLPPP